MRSLKVIAWPAIAVLGLALAGCGASQPAATPSAAPTSPAAQISETGSSLLYPLISSWVAPYTKANPSVQITTASTGSGAGIAGAISGTVQIGASDAYMNDAQLAKSSTPILNIPLAISAQQINYNIPGLNNQHLNLTGPDLAGIYQGTIRYWDDPAIKADNSGVNLPHQAIIPVHRTDGSGDTFIFSQYLAKSAPAWGATNFGTSITFPAVPNAVGANGNPGMVQALSTPYTIAYVGVSFLNQTNQAGYGYAALKNHDGNFVLPTHDNILSAASALVGNTPANERISLIYAPGASSYPIINYEYAMVNTKQASADMAKALQMFLSWAIDPSNGNSATYLNTVHFLPLPAGTVSLSKTQIAKIGS